ncbi:MAG: BrnT family toxin [Stenotrophobium sp.]
MKIEFDAAKNVSNIAERGLSFKRAADFDFSSAVVTENVRFVYPERRFVAVGYLGNRLHALCFTSIEGGIRVISFRKANSRAGKTHEKQLYR